VPSGPLSYFPVNAQSSAHSRTTLPDALSFMTVRCPTVISIRFDFQTIKAPQEECRRLPADPSDPDSPVDLKE